jgi:hypothetical protein
VPTAMPAAMKTLLLCRLRRGIARCLAFLLATPLISPALAADNLVDLQLVLAIDATSSVNEQRFELQKRGYAAAFRNPQVIKAIMSGAEQSIAVTMFQWNGPFTQVQVVPWMMLKDAASAHAFADAIAHSQRELFGGTGTSISGAIEYGVTLLSQSPYKSQRRTIDISGDGFDNTGRPITPTRDEAVRAGVSINGLPIVAWEPRLDHYYYSYVIGGPGAFMIPAANCESFAEAIVKKLILEIAANPPPPGAWGAVLARNR